MTNRTRPRGPRRSGSTVALTLLVAGCTSDSCGEMAPEANLTVTVQADASGDGSGLVTVQTPGLEPIAPWHCTIIDGMTAGDGLNENVCSRDYTASGGTQVLFGAQGSDSHFVGWTGGQCSGTDVSCSVTYVPSLSVSTTIVARVKFETTPGTVQLSIDGQSDALDLLQGLTADAVAMARKANGDVIQGATYSWASSAPAVVTVSGSSTGTASVRGEAPGSAIVTATTRGVASNPVSVTVTAPQSGKGFLEGVLYDVDGVTPLDSVYLSGGPVEGSQGDALRGRTGRQNPLDPGGIPPGGYRFEATNGRYAMFSVAVLGTRYLSTPGDTADVFAGETTELDLFVTEGYGLDMLGTDLGTIEATPGSTVNLTVDYNAWNRDLCPGCVPSLGIGVDATALTVYRFGIAGIYPGKTETGVSIPITVPAEGGTIYATLITTSTGASIEPGLQLYRDRWAANLQGTTMIPIGTLVVN